MHISYEKWITVLGICILSVAGILIEAHLVCAEIYQYTDSQGIIHFTDNPQNVPASIRNKSTREEPLPLSSQDKKIIGELMKRGDIKRDLQFTDPKDAKEGVTYLRESIRKELVDPEELDKPLDPRLSSPEGAISLYRRALRTGNMQDLKACLTNSYWEKMAPGFTTIGKQKMAEMEKDIFSHAEINKIEQDDNYAKLELLVPEDGKTISYPVLVENAFGNWKISDL